MNFTKTDFVFVDDDAFAKRETDSKSLLREANTKRCKLSTTSARSVNMDNDDYTISYMQTTTVKRKPKGLEEWLQIFYNWSHSERIMAFDSLVTSEICEVQQMRHLLSLIEPQLQRDFISLLPKELSLYVLSFLDPTDLLSAAQTCRYWRILCEDNLLWREKCREEDLLYDNEIITDCFRRTFSHQSKSNTCFDAHSPDNSNSHTLNISPQTAFHKSEYKLSYLRHKFIEFNWRNGILNYNPNSDVEQTAFNNSQADNQPFSDNNLSNNRQPISESKNSQLLQKKLKPRRLKEVLHLKGHEDHVITCLQFNSTSNIIVSGSDDNTLKVWSSETGRCLRTLYGHTGGVWSSQLSPDNIVISGSTDRTLRVWNALNGQCLHTLYGHTSTVRCMSLHGNQVVSGSRDATLRVWNINTGECVHVLVGHVAAVRCVQFNGVLCVSGAYDYLVKVWDVASETCLHTLEGHTNRVYSLQFDGKHIVSGSLDTSIRVWSAETGQLKHTLIGHQSLTSGMQLRNNILVSGNADSTVKVWDINTGQCLQTLSGLNKHQSAVTCLQFNSKFVITSSDDGTVKLWDLKTGEFIRNLVSLPSGGSGGVVWRIRASNTKLVCAVGSRNGTEETKLLVLDFETPNSSYDFEHRFTSCDYLNSTSPTSNSVFAETHPHSKSLSTNCLNQFPSCHTPSSTFNNQDGWKPPNTLNIGSQFLNQPKTSSIPSVSSSVSSSALSSLTSTPSSSQMVLPSISLSSSSISSTSTVSKAATSENVCTLNNTNRDTPLNQCNMDVDILPSNDSSALEQANQANDDDNDDSSNHSERHSQINDDNS